MRGRREEGKLHTVREYGVDRPFQRLLISTEENKLSYSDAFPSNINLTTYRWEATNLARVEKLGLWTCLSSAFRHVTVLESSSASPSLAP